MKTLKFKTNIKCGGCIAAVTSHLNAAETVSTRPVDTANPNKILTLEGENLSEAVVIEKVKTAGYTIEMVEG
ncbi:MAG: heavy-metal-associated domain-containing protein [Algoriphagus aquaeductus]|jgi:copper chaperone|uniref:heavy-metal-associated domain-containing protein n=1 Tax=Algoriphagus aquaeductus TaxID=475299 RepID=UPI001BC65251|nr:heavy-metal-associated domain-containing protein [Algoriphagus sp.]MBS4070939.1 heavy-metal-associated domain-containing protein [Algoriphagus sp.]MCM0060093.1 heavy-metal-associated domain-containing protein [Algoriphagus sp.]